MFAPSVAGRNLWKRPEPLFGIIKRKTRLLSFVRKSVSLAQCPRPRLYVKNAVMMRLIGGWFKHEESMNP